MNYGRRAALGLMASTLVAAFAAPALAQVVVDVPMPALRVETMPPPPHPGWHWVPGHWVWRGNAWAWNRGHYVAMEVPAMPAEVVETAPPPPAGPHWVWVKGHYAWEGNAWAWHKGHWVHRA